MHILFLSCLKATELIEKKFLFNIATGEKFRLKIHKIMCKACSIYEIQSNAIHKSLHSMPSPSGDQSDIEKLKKQIINKINDPNPEK